MKKLNLFTGIMSGNCIIKVSSVELISEELNDIEQTLITLGVRIVPPHRYSEKDINDYTDEKYFFGKVDDLLVSTIIIPGMDSFPIYVALEKIGNIFLSVVSDELKVASIVWRGGGSVNIDEKYLMPLKKYWLKKRRLACVSDLGKEKDSILEELKKIEGFSDVYNQYMAINDLKMKAIEELRYEDAAIARDKAKDFLEPLDTFVADYVFSYFKTNLFTF